ncbi:MAG: TlpA family protein disulfide reductase [Ardenticatenaceae bacterium]|nr:TlpA family protein disulfide reductase [Ardenticatenaceae bacterium]
MPNTTRPITPALWLRGFTCIALGLVLVGVLGCRGTSSASQAAPEVETRAPDFDTRLVSGEDLSLTQLRGEPVVLNFWASWCGPCAQELPLLDRAASEGVVIVAVNFGETEDDVEEFLAEHSVSLPVALDPAGKVARLYRVSALPTTFFLDKRGGIRYRRVGELTRESLDAGLSAVR